MRFCHSVFPPTQAERQCCWRRLKFELSRNSLGQYSEGYVARVALQGGLTAAEAADCVNRRSSPLIARVLPVGTEPDLASGQARRELSVWRVDLRPRGG